MALEKAWEKIPHLNDRANNGIEYIKQLQLEERATDPSDADLADGRLYHQTGVGLRIYEAGSWITLGAGGAAGDITSVVAGAGMTGGGVTGDVTLNVINTDGKLTVGADTIDITADSLVNADINSAAAIAYSKLNLTGAVLNADLAGSIAEGKLAITTGAMIIGAAGVGAEIDVSTDTAILIGNSTTAAMQTIGGDASMANDGTLSVSGLTIASAADGDILYRSSGVWVRLAKGTTNQYLEGGDSPSWSLPALAVAGAIADGAELVDSGALDATISFTEQTVAAPSVVIPDFGGAGARTFAFLEFAQTWTANQIVEYGHLFLGDSNDGQTLQILVNEDMTGDKTLTYTPNDGSRIIDLAGNISFSANISTVGDDNLILNTTAATEITLPTTGTVATLAGAEAFTNKTLTLPIIATGGAIVDAGGDEYILFTEDTTPVNFIGITSGDTAVAPMVTADGSDADVDLMLHGKGTGNVVITDGGDITAKIVFELDGATTAKTMTLTHSHTDNRTLTFPDATDTLVGKATVDTLTNKTLDCLGTGNVVTNINIDELDPIGDAAAGVSIIIRKSVASLAAAGTNIITTHKKIRVIDSWFVATSADSGTIAVHVGQVGSIGTAITDTITVAAVDKGISKAGTLDDGAWDVAEDGGLVAVGDGGASIDGVIFVECIRID